MPPRKHSIHAYTVNTETGCWDWHGSLTWNGYGQGSFPNSTSRLAHRFHYEQAKGPIPKGLHLDHLCGNRSCVNPAHLEPVTNAENQRRGNRALLTEEQVREIKRSPRYWGSDGDQAREYGVSRPTIQAIRAGRIWSDVT